MVSATNKQADLPNLAMSCHKSKPNDLQHALKETGNDVLDRSDDIATKDSDNSPESILYNKPSQELDSLSYGQPAEYNENFLFNGVAHTSHMNYDTTNIANNWDNLRNSCVNNHSADMQFNNNFMPDIGSAPGQYMFYQYPSAVYDPISCRSQHRPMYTSADSLSSSSAAPVNQSYVMPYAMNPNVYNMSPNYMDPSYINEDPATQMYTRQLYNTPSYSLQPNVSSKPINSNVALTTRIANSMMSTIPWSARSKYNQTVAPANANSISSSRESINVPQQLMNLNPALTQILHPDELIITEQDKRLVPFKFKARYLVFAGKMFVQRQMIAWREKSLKQKKNELVDSNGDSLKASIYWKEVEAFNAWKNHELACSAAELNALDRERVEYNFISRVKKLYKQRLWEMHWKTVKSQEFL